MFDDEAMKRMNIKKGDTEYYYKPDETDKRPGQAEDFKGIQDFSY